MKKLALLFVTVLAVGVTSCSKDDDAKASLEGTWEYSKEGGIIQGQEILTPYVHATGCAKDYSTITATSVVDHEFDDTDCAETISTINYTRNGNTISIVEGGVTYSATILQLDNSTLKIKGPEVTEGGVTYSDVTVYTRK